MTAAVRAPTFLAPDAEVAAPAPLGQPLGPPAPKKKAPARLAFRTLLWLRERGYLAAKTERWNAFAKKRLDLFGFADVLAVRETIWAIQVCRTDDRTAHVEKLLAEPVVGKVARWLMAGGRVSILSWSHAVPAGRVRARWTLIETPLIYDGLAWSVVAGPPGALTARATPARPRPSGRSPAGRARTETRRHSAAGSSAAGARRGAARDTA